jgi:hypothetical protein
MASQSFGQTVPLICVQAHPQFASVFAEASIINKRGTVTY